MTRQEIEVALAQRRFDIEASEALEMLDWLLSLGDLERQEDLEEHYEQVETLLDIVRDAFQLDSVTDHQRERLASQTSADKYATDSQMTRASMDSCLRMTGLLGPQPR